MSYGKGLTMPKVQKQEPGKSVEQSTITLVEVRSETYPGISYLDDRYNWLRFPQNHHAHNGPAAGTSEAGNKVQCDHTE